MNSDLIPIISLALWTVCLTIGLVGRYVTVQPTQSIRIEMPTQATLVNVTLADNAGTSVPAQTPSERSEPKIDPLPALPAVTAAVPLAVPVPLPIKAAAHISAASGQPKQIPSVFRQITFGTGEGNQPKPDYPIEAQLDGQEGTVEVSFVVDADGHIASAEVTHRCQWPLLNQAAERSIRDTWSYPPGPTRHLKVSITYRHKL